MIMYSKLYVIPEKNQIQKIPRSVWMWFMERKERRKEAPEERRGPHANSWNIA